MLAVCERSVTRGYRHFLYGGDKTVAEKLKIRLQSRFPDLNIVGTYSPPFRPLTADESQYILDMINYTNPDIVWVGLSTPKQERWMAEYIHDLTAPVLIGVGAAFDFLSGSKRQAPRWMQKIGMEWLFRLINEPGRLWKRYIEYPIFVSLVLAQLLGIKSYNLE
jgi:N-acetylglucosaminyldiphosphoundecaprenol N-acetyl-beta-D-mannosaminyltransferase